jgi:peptidoglycan/LPS O-acetylase OafA/YrhL
VRGHIPALDGVRGLAILLVLAVHIRVSPGDLWFDQAFDFVRSGGGIGVDLFFVLSGFLISGILLDSRGGPGYFRAFYFRRVLRIFPLYYLTLAVLFLVLPHLDGLLQN